MAKQHEYACNKNHNDGPCNCKVSKVVVAVHAMSITVPDHSKIVVRTSRHGYTKEVYAPK